MHGWHVCIILFITIQIILHIFNIDQGQPKYLK